MLGQVRNVMMEDNNSRVYSGISTGDGIDYK